MTRKLLLCFALWALGALLPARAETLTVADGETTNSYVPIYGYYCDDYCKCEFVISAEQLTAMQSGTITGLTWYVSSPASVENWGNAKFQVFVKEVNESMLTAFTGTDGATMVYEGQIDGTGSTIDLTFDTPYTYGDGNLLVGVYNTMMGSYSSCYFFGVEVTGAAVYGYSASSLDAINPNSQNFVPKTTFTYTPGSGVTYPTPTGLTVSDITPNSATLSWTAGGTETAWNVAYKKHADTEWTTMAVTATTCTLEDLANGMVYDARVQADCGEGQSRWVTTTFATPTCDPEDMCDITYELRDAYGDGWNGCYIKVVNSNGIEVANLTIGSGGNLVEGTLQLCYGETYQFIWVAGSYPYECGFTFTDSYGEVLLNHDGQSSSSGATAPTPGVLLTYTPRFIACPRPQNLTVSEVTYNSATLGWTPGNEEQDAWQLVLASSADFDPDVDAVVYIEVAGEPTYTVSNLTQSTTYYAYVRGNCGADDKSDWSEVCTFTTLEQYPAPEGLTVAEVKARSAVAGWDGEADGYNLRYRLSSTEGSWTFNETFDNGIPSTWLTVDGDGDGNNWKTGQMDDGNILAYSESYTNTQGALTPDNWLITPQVQLGGSLVFKAGDVGYTETFGVFVSTTGTNPEDFTALSDNVTTTSGDLYDYTIDLSTYAGQTGYIAFRHHNVTDAYYLLIDDVRIGQAVENEWIIVEGVTNPYHFEGLTPDTQYEVQVQAVYGDNTSQWTASAVFTTAEADYLPRTLAINDIHAHSASASWTGVQESYNLRYRTALVRNGFFEDFDNGIPSDWTLIDADGDSQNWYAYNPSNNSQTNYDGNGRRTVLGTACATSASYNNAALTPDNWLITPQVELKGTLSVWLRGQDPSYAGEKFAFYVSTTGKTVDDFTTELVPETTANAVYTEYTADLSSYEGQMGYIAIRHFDVTDKFRLNVDNFYIQQGEEVPAGQWVTIEGVGMPYLILDLDADTEYEIQVQGVDIDGNTDWTDSEFFTTLPANEVTLAEVVSNGELSTTYEISDQLTMVAQTPNGTITYVTDGLGNWARMANLPDGMFNTAAALTNVMATLIDVTNPTLDFNYPPVVVDAQPIVLQTLNLDDLNYVPCQVMNVTAFYVDGLLCSAIDSEQGVKAEGVILTDGMQYDCVVAIENEEETQVLPSGARRAQATPGIKAVVLSASEVIITGIESVNADRKADVRYFDALGRYVRKSLDNAPAGVYVGSDGSKVVK